VVKLVSVVVEGLLELSIGVVDAALETIEARRG
jgi:hypothetical protein